MAVVQKSKHVAVYCRQKEFKSKQELFWVEKYYLEFKSANTEKRQQIKFKQNQVLSTSFITKPQYKTLTLYNIFLAQTRIWYPHRAFIFVALCVNNT